MVEKGVPSGRSGGVADSSGGQNYPSAVATSAAEHPQVTDFPDFKVSPPWPCGINGCAEPFSSFHAWIRHHKDAHQDVDVWRDYEAFLRVRLGSLSVETQREILNDKKLTKQKIIDDAHREILVLNKMLEELK